MLLTLMLSVRDETLSGRPYALCAPGNFETIP